jgi:uncharacterized membrane protein YdjX (TVP38/TMEM64 family)
VSYLVVFAVVLGVNLLPAFGPPTWSILVLYRLNSHLNAVVLVAVGAVAAAVGRFLLAAACRTLRGHFSDERLRSLEAVRSKLARGRAKSAGGLALFAISPLPSAQLFEAAGLMNLPLVPFVAAFFAGRIVSYSLYVTGASALKASSLSDVVTRSITDWRGIGLQVVLLVGVVALTRIDWARRLGVASDEAPTVPSERGRGD